MAKFEWFGDSVKAKLVGTAAKNVQLAGVYLKSKIKLKLSGNRSGRVYRVPGTKTLYTASAPGEAPASRTGTLRNAIVMKVTKTVNTVAAHVGPKKLGPDPGYAFYLEFGTRKMSPRPFLRPVFKEEKGQVEFILKQGWG